MFNWIYYVQPEHPAPKHIPQENPEHSPLLRHWKHTRNTPACMPENSLVVLLHRTDVIIGGAETLTDTEGNLIKVMFGGIY